MTGGSTICVSMKETVKLWLMKVRSGAYGRGIPDWLQVKEKVKEICHHIDLDSNFLKRLDDTSSMIMNPDFALR